jgi:hypothetical protein
MRPMGDWKAHEHMDMDIACSNEQSCAAAPIAAVPNNLVQTQPEPFCHGGSCAHVNDKTDGAVPLATVQPHQEMQIQE